MQVTTYKNALFGCWVITGVAAVLLMVYLGLAHTYGIKFQMAYALPESERIMVRSGCYLLAIIGFPVTNLIRHVQLRLNQTMPGTRSAQQRYQTTILVSMSLLQSSALLGLLLFGLGDGRNSLYILVGMSALAIYLYRPKDYELQAIEAALAAKSTD